MNFRKKSKKSVKNISGNINIVNFNKNSDLIEK